MRIFLPFTSDDEILYLPPDAPALRAAFMWMQNNSPSTPLTPTSDSVATSTTEYTWPLTAVSPSNYPGFRRRYRDTQYTGAAGEGNAPQNLIDATTSDLNVVRLCDSSGAQQATSKVTSIPSNGQFVIVGAGMATITYRFKHPADDSVVLTLILTINAS